MGPLVATGLTQSMSWDGDMYFSVTNGSIAQGFIWSHSWKGEIT